MLQKGETMRIQLIGTKDDPVFQELREKILKAIHDLGINAVLDEISNLEEMENLPIAVYPALLINQKPIASGHPLSYNKIKKVILEAVIEEAAKSKTSNPKVLVLRTRSCRKSDIIIRFLEQENIPHEVKYLEDDPEAQALAKKYKIKASPGIIVNKQLLNPYQLLEKCRIKHPQQTRTLIFDLLGT